MCFEVDAYSRNVDALLAKSEIYTRLSSTTLFSMNRRIRKVLSKS